MRRLAEARAGRALRSLGPLAVQSAVTLRVVAYQLLAEDWDEGFDVRRKMLTALEVELVPSAPLSRTGRDEAVSRIAQDRGAEFLVDQDAGFPQRTGGKHRAKTLIDVPLHASALGRLRLAARRLPAEQAWLEGAAMIERLDIDWAIIVSRHQPASFSLR